MTTIVLKAGPEEELSWRKEREQAEACSSILWEMDWGSYTGIFTDQTIFSSQTLALQTWTKTFGDLIDKTTGIILYQGPACPYLPCDEEQTLFQKRVYASGILFEYLHRLGSFLPDTISLLAKLDAREIESAAEQAILFSPEHTPYLQILLNGGLVPVPHKPEVTCGVCLPTEDYWTEDVIRKLDSLLRSLKDYRLVPENLINEQWDGLEEILVMEETLSKKGRRCLQGFAAAGGRTVFV